MNVPYVCMYVCVNVLYETVYRCRRVDSHFFSVFIMMHGDVCIEFMPGQPYYLHVCYHYIYCCGTSTARMRCVVVRDYALTRTHTQFSVCVPFTSTTTTTSRPRQTVDWFWTTRPETDPNESARQTMSVCVYAKARTMCTNVHDLRTQTYNTHAHVRVLIIRAYRTGCKAVRHRHRHRALPRMDACTYICRQCFTVILTSTYVDNVLR